MFLQAQTGDARRNEAPNGASPHLGKSCVGFYTIFWGVLLAPYGKAWKFLSVVVAIVAASCTGSSNEAKPG